MKFRSPRKRRIRPNAKQAYVALERATTEGILKARAAGRAAHEFAPEDVRAVEQAGRTWATAMKREGIS